MDDPKSPTPPGSGNTAKEPPHGKAPGFLTVAAGILILVIEYILKGLWAFIRFFLPRWMK